jgi:protein involved in polysaccharide export with SLBB domain
LSDRHFGKEETVRNVVKFTISILLAISFNVMAQDNQTYRLSTGDVLSVTVFNEPELGLKEAKITDDGRISVPLLGQVAVKGKTVFEVEELLTELFVDGYLKKPSVSVAIAEYRPFYINGEVAKPGSYAFRTKMTVQIAITLAGGFTERASRKSIYLLKEAQGSKRIRVTLSDDVSPGDVITVDESFF